MSIPLPYPTLSFTPLDVLTAEEMNQIVANYTYIANNASGGGGGGASVLDCYPIGSYYETSDITFNPNTAWGGTWVLDSQGRVTVSQDSSTFATVGSTGGAATASHSHETYGHVLTTSEMPQHSHGTAIDGNFLTGTMTVSSRGSDFNSILLGDKYILYTSNSGSVRQSGNTYTASAGYGNSHSHGATSTTSASTLQPYVVVRRWHRTA